MHPSPTTQRFAVDEVELAWERWGGPDAVAGTELVLCHGYSGSAHDFALVADDLAADRSVLTLDHRGHGRSSSLGREDGYSLARLVTDLAAFLSATTTGPVDLLGHSMGGRLALLTALDHPELVRSLILMDTSAWSFRSADEDLRSLIDGFLAGYDPSTGLPDLGPLAGPEDALIAAATPAEWRARKLEEAAAFDPFALRALGRELFAEEPTDVRARLAELAVPVTVIVGRHDHPFVDQAAALAAETRADELVAIDGAYHSPQLTHPEAWTAAVRRHLARAEAVGATADARPT